MLKTDYLADQLFAINAIRERRRCQCQDRTLIACQQMAQSAAHHNSRELRFAGIKRKPCLLGIELQLGGKPLFRFIRLEYLERFQCDL